MGSHRFSYLEALSDSCLVIGSVADDVVALQTLEHATDGMQGLHGPPLHHGAATQFANELLHAGYSGGLARFLADCRTSRRLFLDKL